MKMASLNNEWIDLNDSDIDDVQENLDSTDDEENELNIDEFGMEQELNLVDTRAVNIVNIADKESNEKRCTTATSHRSQDNEKRSDTSVPANKFAPFKQVQSFDNSLSCKRSLFYF